MNFETKILKFFGRLAAVSITVKYYLHSCIFQGLYFVKNINYTSIVGGIRDIERNYMKVFSRHIKLGSQGSLTVKVRQKY